MKIAVVLLAAISCVTAHGHHKFLRLARNSAGAYSGVNNGQFYGGTYQVPDNGPALFNRFGDVPPPPGPGLGNFGPQPGPLPPLQHPGEFNSFFQGYFDQLNHNLASSKRLGIPHHSSSSHSSISFTDPIYRGAFSTNLKLQQDAFNAAQKAFQATAASQFGPNYQQGFSYNGGSSGGFTVSGVNGPGVNGGSAGGFAVSGANGPGLNGGNGGGFDGGNGVNGGHGSGFNTGNGGHESRPNSGNGGHGSGLFGGNGVTGGHDSRPNGANGGHDSGLFGGNGANGGHGGKPNGGNVGQDSGLFGGNGSNGGHGNGFNGGAQTGAVAGASAIFGTEGGHQTANILPPNPAIPNINNRFGGPGPIPGGTYGVSTLTFTGAIDVNGKKTTFKQATTSVNDNGKITTYTTRD